MCKAGALSGLILSLVAGIAHANDADQMAYGEFLSGQCVTCHQLSGAENGIPMIIGWDVTSFFQVMDTYRLKARDNQVMPTIAAALTDDDIKALATYFAAQKPLDQ